MTGEELRMEDPNLATIMMLRIVERTLAVTIGGIAIYLGYRLFVLLPTQTDSSGKIELPGYSVVLSKVGPGIFFAAFGAIVLYLSFANPIKIDGPGGGITGATPVEPLPTLNKCSIDNTKRSTQAATPQMRERVRQSLQVLNCMERVVTMPRNGMRSDDVEGPVRDAKIALLGSIWSEENWGSPEALQRWAAIKQGKISDELKGLYLSELPGCPA